MPIRLQVDTYLFSPFLLYAKAFYSMSRSCFHRRDALWDCPGTKNVLKNNKLLTFFLLSQQKCSRLYDVIPIKEGAWQSKVCF